MTTNFFSVMLLGMIILGIETSCDETACGIVRLTDQQGPELLANAVLSSMDLHETYGGVVPEIAARSHIESIIPVIEQALSEAFPPVDSSKKLVVGKDNPFDPSTTYQLPPTNFDPWDHIDGIAVTYGAGLGGSLLIGVMTARTLAITKNKPLYAINHVEGHVYANFLTSASPTLSTSYQLPATVPAFPCLALIVSGGHSQLALFRDHFDYTLLGQTQDDAVGEAFDKVAKIIGLPYPGGPSVGKKALEGNPHAFNLPKAQMKSISPALIKLRSEVNAKSVGADGVQGANEELQRAIQKGMVSEHRSSATQQSAASNTFGYDFSFSGVKTAVLRHAQEMIGQDFTFPSYKLPEALSEAQKADIAAVFQRVAIETVVDKTLQAYEEFSPASVVIAGGVAASPELRRQLKERLPIEINYTDPKLCTDNGAMIATLGCYKAMLKQPTVDPYSLEIAPNLSM
jgi:N6-L-threonylcarbamoyladenine synthase